VPPVAGNLGAPVARGRSPCRPEADTAPMVRLSPFLRRSPANRWTIPSVGTTAIGRPVAGGPRGIVRESMSVTPSMWPPVLRSVRPRLRPARLRPPRGEFFVFEYRCRGRWL